MNILLINHYAGSPEMGMEFRPYYLAQEWKKQGHRVLIVGATFSHLRKKQPQQSGFQTIDGIDYYWVKTNEYHGNGIQRVKSMWLFVSRLLRDYKKICQNFVPDAVIASSTYTFDNYAARRIAKHFSAKYIYEIHDLWPLSPMELGGMSKFHPFIMMLQHAENYAYRNCDAVVSILPNAKAHCVEHGLLPEKFHHVPNGIVKADWEAPKAIPEEHRLLILRLRVQFKFVIGYVGGHALSNSLDTLLNAAKEVARESIAIVLVGDGIEKERLQKRTAMENITNVFFLPSVSKLQIPCLLSEMDALYIGWRRNPLYRYGISPNKIFDYAMAGKPIIHAVDAANDPVSEAECGISVPCEDTQAIAQAMIQLAKLPQEEIERLGENGHQFVLQHHTYDVLSENFIKAINH